MAFVDLEKAFDRVPRKLIWWAIRKPGVNEWTVKLVVGMYENVRSRVRVGEVHSPLLFITMLEALSCEFQAGIPWQDLYADDLVIIVDCMEDCISKLLTKNKGIERKGLGVNAGKTKVIIYVQYWTYCKVQASFHVPSAALE